MALSDEDVEFLGDWLKSSEEAVEDLDRKLTAIMVDVGEILTLMRWALFLMGASIFIVGASQVFLI